MRDQPLVFDELCIQMVAVGEESGTLDAALDQLADFAERYQRFKDKVITSLIYPLLVLTMSAGGRLSTGSLFSVSVLFAPRPKIVVEIGRAICYGHSCALSASSLTS